MSKTCTVYDRPRVWLVMFDRISASMPFKQRCQPGSYHIYHIYILCIQQNGCQWAFLPNLQCYKMKLQTWSTMFMMSVNINISSESSLSAGSPHSVLNTTKLNLSRSVCVLHKMSRNHKHLKILIYAPFYIFPFLYSLRALVKQKYVTAFFFPPLEVILFYHQNIPSFLELIFNMIWKFNFSCNFYSFKSLYP